jgi:hypothetical protein
VGHVSRFKLWLSLLAAPVAEGAVKAGFQVPNIVSVEDDLSRSVELQSSRFRAGVGERDGVADEEPAIRHPLAALEGAAQRVRGSTGLLHGILQCELSLLARARPEAGGGVVGDGAALDLHSKNS